MAESTDVQKATQKRYEKLWWQAVHQGNNKTVVAALQQATHHRLRYPLRVEVSSIGSDKAKHLPLDPAAYENTVFSVNGTSTNKTNVHQGGVFGYAVKDTFRRVGPIQFVSFNADESVAELSFGSNVLRDHFQRHLYGRSWSEADHARLIEVQEAVFAHLQSLPGCSEKLRKFEASRNWPNGLAAKLKLAYLDAQEADLIRWSEKNGFSLDEMADTGWIEINFDKLGQPSYSVRDNHVVRIPYFDTEGRITMWRTRNLRGIKAESHKYTSWPLDRSVDNRHLLAEKLYNGWLLGTAKGKTLVITEGEFKCDVATHYGQLTVGIPGITEVDDETIERLVAAKASRYVVVFDRDPVGKGLMRIDSITDSQRAAFLIAMRLRAAGAKDVVVASIPDVRDGEKVGLDDLILDLGKPQIAELLESAERPAEYAKSTGLNPLLCKLFRTRQQIRKALEHYEYSVKRGGTQVCQAVYDEAVEIEQGLNEAYRGFLAEFYYGATRINQAGFEHASWWRLRTRPDEQHKLALTEDGQSIPLAKFGEEIAEINFTASGARAGDLWIMRSWLDIAVSAQDLLACVHGTTSDRFQTWRITRAERLITAGLDALGKTVSQAELQRADIETLGLYASAGQLSQWFPDDEYKILANVHLLHKRDAYWEEVSIIPLVVQRRSSGNVIVVSGCSVWSFTSSSRDDVRQAKHTQRMLANRIFFRPEAGRSVKFDALVDTIWPYWFERNLEATTIELASLGIPRETIEREQLIVVKKQDQSELHAHLSLKHLAAEANRIGLFWRALWGGERRFMDDFALLPLRSADGKIVSLRVLPLGTVDYARSLPPQNRIVQNLYGPMYSGNSNGLSLYQAHNAEEARGATLFVTLHELDALALSDTRAVVGLNGAFALSHVDRVQIVELEARRICFVVSGQTPASKYDWFSADGVQGYLKEIYEVAQGLRVSPARVDVASVSSPLTQIAAHMGAEDCAQRLRQEAVPLANFLKQKGFVAAEFEKVHRFLNLSNRLCDYFEMRAVATGGQIDGRPIDWWVSQCTRIYQSICGFTQSKYKQALPPIEEYFASKLRLKAALPLAELVRLVKEEGQSFLRYPVYRFDQQQTIELTPEFAARLDELHEAWYGEESLAMNRLHVAASAQGSGSKGGVGKASLAAKTAVLERVARFNKATSTPLVSHITEDNWVSCVVRVCVGEKIYAGGGEAWSKRQAESLGYGEILDQLKADSIGEPEPRESQADLKHRALALIDGREGDENSLSRLKDLAKGLGFNKPVSVHSTSTADGRPAWQCTTTFRMDDGETIESQPVIAGSKKDGLQLAARDLLPKIRAHFESLPDCESETSDNSEQVSNIKNKVKVLEYAQSVLREAPSPQIQLDEEEDGFVCTVKLTVDEQTYEGTGKAGSKKVAEDLAYAEILKQVNKLRYRVGPPKFSTKQEQVMAVLTQELPQGSNFVGHLNRVVQILGINQPYEEFCPAPSGNPGWQAVFSLVLGDGTQLVSDAQLSPSKKEARHMAARNMVAHLRNHLG